MDNSFVMSSNSVRRRRHTLGVLAFATLGLAVYGSFLPMKFEAVTPEEAREAFRNLDWLGLGIYKRADWVANGLIILVPSFLASAAIDWGRPTRFALITRAPFMVAGLVIVVAGIEYFQAYVPIRTQSLNDLVAGCIGACLGPFVYLTLGRPFANAFFKLRDVPLQDKLRWGIVVFLFLSLAYAVMPLDMVFHPSELAEKYRVGRLQLLPPLEEIGSFRYLKSLCWSILRGALIAGMIYANRDARAAIVGTTIFAVGYELLQVPVFSRLSSLSAVVATCMGIPAGILGARFLRRTNLASHAFVWLTASFVMLAGVAIVTMSRSSGWSDQASIGRGWEGFWGWPLRRYYYSSEFDAGTNLLAKLGSFAIIGFGLAVGVSKLPRRLRFLCTTVSAAAVILVAVAIEVMQVYLEPHIADGTDVITYVLGALLGYLTYDYFFDSSESFGEQESGSQVTSRGK